MRESLTELICSPLTKRKLDLEVFETKSQDKGGKQIISARLFNGDEEYPVINGIPRLLIGDLLTETLKKYPDFTEKFHNKFSGLSRQMQKNESRLKKDTQESFGIQWNIFSDMYEVWKNNFLDYISPHLEPGDFKDRIVLDCGCGFGRHLYYAAEFGAKHAVGIDLSHSVDAAAKNVSALPNAHVIQADIYRLPLVQTFDTAYCIGVLQHTPDPVRAFQCIAETLVSEGNIFAWIYGKRPISYHLTVDLLRTFTVKLKPKSIYRITLVLAFLSFGILALPRRFLSSLGLGKIGKMIPFSGYAEYPFRVSHADWYDRLAAPKTEYFDEQFPEKLLDSINCTDKKITFRKGGSWKVYGRKAENSIKQN